MRITRMTIAFIGIIVLACLLLSFSVWDIVYHEGWWEAIAILYTILFIVLVLLYVSYARKKSEASSTVEAFEKSLKGALHHFKCPSCQGIFAIKKSKHNNKKTFTLTCPDCGNIGCVPSKPHLITEEVPEKKSVNKNFTCDRCGEGVMIWAEGTDLAAGLRVYSCPYCGTQDSMRLT